MSSIPKGRGLFLDQTAEWIPLWQKFGNWSYFGQDFIWCAMSTMGGNVGLYGNMERLNTGPIDAASIPNASITGVGIDPEGIDTNPAYYTFILDAAWRKTTVNVSDWLGEWSRQRCGAVSQSAQTAWELLGQTVYADVPEQM
jgi:alpha-N-acetylglucosaminidase